MERSGDRLRHALRPGNGDGGEPLDLGQCEARFFEAMDDDLNTPRALAALFDLAREINRGREDSRPVAEAQATLRELAGVLGLTLAAPDSADGLTGPLVEVLAEVRSELRAARQFDLADRIRSRLQDLGVLLEDSAQGTTWRLQR